ncbi:MAG TPA: esterase-like activity of phytase family protein [Pseudonocardiaceae bacterium]|nr:esterase-like activity of phytase family protein [Pseudonocardiaceae bacterium]
MSLTAKRRTATTTVAGAALVLLSLATAPGASAHPAPVSPVFGGSRACAPNAAALSFSDALDKLVYNGAKLGGLSSLAYDSRSHAWVSAVDNNGADPARIWFFRDLAHPTVVRDPLVLKRPDGTPYDGTDSDNEGLAVLPDGDYLVSSETEPSIRIYGRDGVQKASLPVPARFAVAGTTPAGQAMNNATLEGLTITPNGKEIIAAMEGALSGDVSATGDANAHRLLVYRQASHGTWRLDDQIAYRADTGMRIPEVAAYGDDSIVVEEAAFAVPTGNAVELFAVTGLNRAKDVSSVSNLSAAPARDFVSKKLVSNLVDCPTLGAQAKEAQANPLLDNFEGMAVTGHAFGLTGISMISDDNFSATQTTRVLNLVARLP